VRTQTLGHVPVQTSTKVKITIGSQSTGVGMVQIGTAGHWMVLGAGRALITGAVVSTTVMVCEAVDVLPQSSLAVQVRTHTLGQVPVQTSTKVNVAGPQLSVAVGVAKTGTAGHTTVLGPGSEEMTGAVVSGDTVTTWSKWNVCPPIVISKFTVNDPGPVIVRIVLQPAVVERVAFAPVMDHWMVAAAVVNAVQSELESAIGMTMF
jgi:hypothetical protein